MWRILMGDRTLACDKGKRGSQKFWKKAWRHICTSPYSKTLLPILIKLLWFLASTRVKEFDIVMVSSHGQFFYHVPICWKNWKNFWSKSAIRSRGTLLVYPSLSHPPPYFTSFFSSVNHTVTHTQHLHLTLTHKQHTSHPTLESPFAAPIPTPFVRRVGSVCRSRTKIKQNFMTSKKWLLAIKSKKNTTSFLLHPKFHINDITEPPDVHLIYCLWAI